MEEPVRLVCPDCDLVYRVKKLTLGKEYKCRKCGGGLLTLEPVSLHCPSCGAVTETERLNPAAVPTCENCAEAPPLALPAREAAAPAGGEETSSSPFESQIANENQAALASVEQIPDRRTSRRERSARLSPESDLARLPRLIEDLTARLELLKNVGIGDGGEAGDTAGRLLRTTEGLSENLATLNGELTRDMRELDGKVAGLLEKLAGEDLSALAEQVRETGSLFLSRLEDYREAQKAELAALMAPPPAADHSGTTVEVDIDELADRLVAGIRHRTPLLDTESGSAVDALAKVADELVREQSANTGRLDSLADEIRNAVSGIAKMDEWRGGLPARVADEIGRTVEERVVGPVSTALSRQAPAILADLQDNKLVDIVSRSVREAQRPLLREILSGGRQGVPAWLFASVLLPLLLVLGYLFLPGELGFGDNAAKLEEISQTLQQFRSAGIPVNDETYHQLSSIDEHVTAIGGGVQDIHEKAMEHVKNAATLEQHAKNLEATLKEREQLLEDYKQTLDDQVKRINLYETRLIQLGVPPNSIQ